jgi:hypothetical protein
MIAWKYLNTMSRVASHRLLPAEIPRWYHPRKRTEENKARFRDAETMKRVLAAAILAIPLAFVAFGIAEHAPIPNSLRFIISPGNLLFIRTFDRAAIRYLGSVPSLGASMWATLLINTVYIMILILGLFRLVTQIERHRTARQAK